MSERAGRERAQDASGARAERRAARAQARNARWSRNSPRVLSLVAGSSVLACTAASTRPHFEPLPGSLVDTVGIGPGQAIRTLASELEASGLTLQAQSLAEGYLETRWYDPVLRRSVGREHRHPGRVFRLRAYADSIPPSSSQLVLEAVYRRTADPSAPGREEEILVPPGHPGDSLAQRLLGGLRQRFGRSK